MQQLCQAMFQFWVWKLEGIQCAKGDRGYGFKRGRMYLTESSKKGFTEYYLVAFCWVGPSWIGKYREGEIMPGPHTGISQQQANFFYKELNSRYFRLYGTHNGFCPIFSSSFFFFFKQLFKNIEIASLQPLLKQAVGRICTRVGWEMALVTNSWSGSTGCTSKSKSKGRLRQDCGTL